MILQDSVAMKKIPPVTEDNSNTNQNNSQNTTTKYNVTFRVTNATNQGLSNVSVTLTDTTDATNTESGTTDNGDVTISVKPGTYSVTATREGYTAPTTIANVTVTDSNVTVSDAIIMTSE